MEHRTKQYSKRSAILSCLECTDSHPSAEMVCQMVRQQRPDISVATVYRNLALFKSQGIIQSVGTVGGSERFDFRTEPHVHFICTGCDSVIDLPQISVPTELTDQAEIASGCQIGNCQLTFTGLCRNCKGDLT